MDQVHQEFQPLRDTKWLAKRLGLKVATIEKMRSRYENLPPHYFIFNSIVRYDERDVDEWIKAREIRRSKPEI